MKIERKDIFLVVLVCSFVLLYYPVWKELVLAWNSSEDYSHGFFVVPVAIYVLWKKREDFSLLPVEPSGFGMVLLVGSLFVYILALYAEIKTVASLAMIVSIAAVVLYLYGSVILRQSLYPLFLLLFMIPIPSQIYSAMTIPLQIIVTQASVWFSALVGLPIFREGNVIYLPQRTLEVVQACSGLRSLMTLLTLSVIISYFTLRSNWLRGLLLLFGVPVAIVVNIIRVLIMIFAFYYFDFDLTQGTIHTIFGIAVFVLAIALVFLCKGVLSFWDRPVLKK